MTKAISKVQGASAYQEMSVYLIISLIFSSKKKKPSPDNNAPFTTSENSNDSTMDIIFEDIRLVLIIINFSMAMY